MFCGSPRRYQPRWFRSPPMAGIKEENGGLQAIFELRRPRRGPDGLFPDLPSPQEGKSFLDPRGLPKLLAWQHFLIVNPVDAGIRAESLGRVRRRWLLSTAARTRNKSNAVRPCRRSWATVE